MNSSSPNLDTLQMDSPHLSGVLARKFSREREWLIKGEEIREQIEGVYQLSRKLGGNREYHFERKAGTSFNPRAARIPLVLLTALPDAEPEAVALAILSSLILVTDSKSTLTALSLDEEYLNITSLNSKECAAQYVRLLSIHQLVTDLSIKGDDASNLSQIKNMDNNPMEIMALVSMFVDKIRHLHLIPAPILAGLSQHVRLEAEIYIKLAHSYMTFYEPHIRHWLNRHSRISSN